MNWRIKMQLNNKGWKHIDSFYLQVNRINITTLVYTHQYVMLFQNLEDSQIKMNIKENLQNITYRFTSIFKQCTDGWQ